MAIGIGFDLGGLVVYSFEAITVGLFRTEFSLDADSDAGKCDDFGLSEPVTACLPCDLKPRSCSKLLDMGRLLARLLPRVGGLEGEIVFPAAS